MTRPERHPENTIRDHLDAIEDHATSGLASRLPLIVRHTTAALRILDAALMSVHAGVTVRHVPDPAPSNETPDLEAAARRFALDVAAAIARREHARDA